MNTDTSALTPYKRGSLLEFWHIALPLMLTSLSFSIMMFLDRVLLANYSLHSMNAVAAVGMIFFVFEYFFILLASITEVFVGQYNGAKQYHKIGAPVWQMMWVTLSSIIIFWALGFFFAPALIVDNYQEQGLPYFQWLCYFGAAFPFSAALTSFYVGRGKVKYVIFGTVVSNATNIILDIVLIYGISNVIPSLGTKGAAIATIISQLIYIVLLFIPFLSKKNREKYGTTNYKINPSLLKKCLKTGLPTSIGHSVEITAWAFVMAIVSQIGQVHMTLLTVGQTLFIFISFATDGMNKAMKTLCSNAIGENKYEYIPKILKSGVTLLFIIAVILISLVFIMPNLAIDIFIKENHAILDIAGFETSVFVVLFCVWLFFVFDSLTWQLAGIFIAAGATKFIMYTNAITSWVFGLLPVYVFMKVLGFPPLTTWAIHVIYAIVNFSCFFIYYKRGSWKKSKLVDLGSNNE